MLVSADDWRPQGVDDLEPRAWEALRLVDQDLLVTAGAGAGKTEFLAQKAAFLLQTGICVAPRRILAISFKRDAAENLDRRVSRRCSVDQARRFNSYTFDGFAKGLVDRFRAALPDAYRPPKDYHVVLPKRADFEAFLDDRGIRGVPPQRLEKGIARLALPVEGGASETHAAVAEYWRAQFEDYSGDVPLSFSMINRLAELLLRENPRIGRALQITYPFVFLDEFQDTTHAQFELLATAFGQSDSVFTAVGDDKQRIMLWAGAMPDAFARFEDAYDAKRVSLLSNFRSHADLVRIQHAVAVRIDDASEAQEAHAEKIVDGEIAAIWEFETRKSEREHLAGWIAREVDAEVAKPEDIAILVRMRADRVEEELAPAMAEAGLRLRNVARVVGDISIQDLLEEELTGLLLAALELGATARSPESWERALGSLQFLRGADLVDELAQERLRGQLEEFVRYLRRLMRAKNVDPDTAKLSTEKVLDFVGIPTIRRGFPAYRRSDDFERVKTGFVLLLEECAEGADSWEEAIAEFRGDGQVPLMTVHKSKGLEFHTMIFFGLDNESWWSLTPDRAEELNTFFVALTRAKQRAFFSLATQRGGPVRWVERILEPAGVSRIVGEDAVQPT